MNRVQRALSRADFDAFLRADGFRNQEHAMDLARLHSRLDAGARITREDIERIHQHYPAIPRELFLKIAQHIDSGRSGRERADRFTDCVYGHINPATGIPVASSPMRDRARSISQSLITNEYANDVTERLAKDDQHRDKHNGIDQAARAEEAKRAAMRHPDNIRRGDVERAWDAHAGPQPALYAADRRELLAQASERLADRMMKRVVRDSDPNRVPDRGDDRRDDLALAYDQFLVNTEAADELTLARNPALERADDQVTQEEAEGRMTE